MIHCGPEKYACGHVDTTTTEEPPHYWHVHTEDRHYCKCDFILSSVQRWWAVQIATKQDWFAVAQLKIWTTVSEVPFQAHRSVQLLMWNGFLMGHEKILNWGWTSDMRNWHFDSCGALGPSTAEYSRCFTECHLVVNCSRTVQWLTEVKWKISHIKIDVFINIQPSGQNEKLALDVSMKHSYVGLVHFICGADIFLLHVI